MPYEKRPSGGIIIEASTVLTANWLGPWLEINGVTGDITLPGASPSKVDILTHRDVLTYGGFGQNGAGIAEVTDLAFDLLCDPMDSTFLSLIADMSSRAARDYRITFPPGGVTPVTTKWGVRGQVGMTNRGPLKGYLMSSVTVLANVIKFNVA